MPGFLLWGALVGIAAGAAIGAIAIGLRRTRLGERRERWQDQTTAPAGAMLNALFLAAFALSLVICWQNYDHAKADASAEGATLVVLYNDLGELPNGDQLRAELHRYASTVVNQEWPLLAQGRSVSAADAQLRVLNSQILALRPDNSGLQDAQAEVLKEFDAMDDARTARLGDTTSALPLGILLCVLVTALAALTHGLLVGLPHTPSSLIPLMIEAALLACATYVIVLIRQPYHGALLIGPDHVRIALATFEPSS